LPAGVQDVRFRLGRIRRERDIELAKVAIAFNLGIAELAAEAHAEREKIQADFGERIRVAAGHQQKKTRHSKDTGEQARRLGIALPTLEETRQALKEKLA
jgi:hypothetical protein